MVINAGTLSVAMKTLLRRGSYHVRQFARFGNVDSGVMVAVKQPDGNILQPSGYILFAADEGGIPGQIFKDVFHCRTHGRKSSHLLRIA
jgi:hypothetical protein